MNDYDYNIIKIFIIDWCDKILTELNTENDIVISKNNEDTLVVDFTFINCIAQLSVTNSEYNPYQFVYFEAIDIESSNVEEIMPIYCFYDNYTMKIDDVLNGLDEALLFCLNYKRGEH